MPIKLKNRIKAAINAFRVKSEDETLTLNQFLQAFGISATLSGPALSEATYYACLKVLSETIGKLPFRVLHKSKGLGVVEMRDNAWWKAIHTRPNRYMTATTFWGMMELSRQHYGNAYAYIDFRDPSAPQLWPMNPDNVTLYYDNAKKLADQPDIYYRYTIGGMTQIFKSEEVLHFKTHLTLDGIRGKSVSEQLASVISGQRTAQNMVNKLYASGMTAKATLQYTGGLNDANVKELIDMVTEYAGSDTTRNVIPLPVGFAMQPLNLKLADSQFFEIRQATALQIAAAFGVKPSQIGDYTKSSYASAEAQQLAFLVDTMLYIVKGYGEELTSKLLSEDDQARGVEIKANTAVLLQASRDKHITSLKEAVSGFLMTVNEAREELDLPADPHGNVLVGNGATIRLSQVGSQYGNNTSGKEVKTE